MLVSNLLSGSERIVHRYTSLAIVTAAFSFGMAAAATPAIGVALSEGTIVVNDAQTPGNATVFNGTTLQTQQASSQVRLKDGAQVRFDLDSRGTLFSDHVDLKQGTARISDYSANANGLSVRASGDSSASVTMKGKVVEVAASLATFRFSTRRESMSQICCPGGHWIFVLRMRVPRRLPP